MTLKQSIFLIILFIVCVFGSAEIIRRYTLWTTAGECDVVGTCSCETLNKYGYVIDTCLKNLDVYRNTAAYKEATQEGELNGQK